MSGFWLRDQHPDQADHRRGQHQHRPEGQRDPADVQVTGVNILQNFYEGL